MWKLEGRWVMHPEAMVGSRSWGEKAGGVVELKIPPASQRWELASTNDPL